MSTITVRLNEKEQKIFEEYAKLYDMPLSTLLKQALEEKIEDELDFDAIKLYEEDIKNDDVVVYEHDEVKKMLDL
ncbi:type II toxin-antitoxin system RelB family antitoxin [Salinicoccus kekensis]|uniref:Uncharacterized protein n=1 Tax=Salinicoccus kekensis TaxID=714307 RepID=A0A285UIJ8_9STAP|nr:DUF6290 family protein [Salinicoccus kekensis]SOC41603.1 hypothetical protein SAMN05878391_1335 [Salinicoccus kekensis]